MLENSKIVKALNEVLTHKSFASSPKASAFLAYVVTETLEGRGDALSETTIAQDVYGKGGDFDPSQDSLIRGMARRVRTILELYYLKNEPETAIKITIPVGHYHPKFERSIDAASVTESKTSNSADPISSNPHPAALEKKSSWIRIATVAVLAIFALSIIIVKFDQSDHPVHEAKNNAIAESSITEDNLQASAYPMVAVTPFENQTKLERYDFLETVLQKKLVEDISRFDLLTLVAYEKPIEAVLADTERPYNYVISSTILSVEPEMDLLLKVIDVETSSTIYEQRVRRSVETSDYFDSLSEIVSELSVRSYFSITTERLNLIEDQINQGKVELSELEVFECVRLSYKTIATKSSKRYKQAYSCLENLLEQDAENAVLLSHFGVLTFAGARERVYDAKSYYPNLKASDGVAFLERAVEIDPENAVAHYFLSEAYVESGKRQEALEHAEIAHILNPTHHGMLIGVSRQLASNGEFERALTFMNKVIDKHPNPRGYFYHAAFVSAMNNKDNDELQKVANKIDELGYIYSDIFLFLAAVANEDTKAVEDLRPRVIALAQSNFDTNLNGHNTLVKWSTLYGKEDIVAKSQALFTKGGIVLETQ